MKRMVCRYGGLFLLPLLMAWNAGCQTAASPAPLSSSRPSSVMSLLPGDDIEISVFGVPDLNTVQKIRPDGKISAKLFGDIQAAGKTPTDIQKELTKLYESQLQVKSITVIARSSAIVYVTGAVPRPGKVEYLRPLTAFEAIMECGGFDQKAGASRDKVLIIRTERNETSSYVLDLDEILTKGTATPFYLKPFDTVYVPGSWW